MGLRRSYRNIMKGKPRRKKGETEKHYRGRLKEWKGSGIEKTAAITDSMVLESILDNKPIKDIELFPEDENEPKPTKREACIRCEHWVQNMPKDGRGQCSFYPTWIITTDIHYCGKFKNNNKHILGEV